MSHLSHCGMGAEPRASRTRAGLLLPTPSPSVCHSHTPVCLSHTHTHTHTPRLLQGAKSWVAVAHSQSVCLSLTHIQIPVYLTHTHTYTHTHTHPYLGGCKPQAMPPHLPIQLLFLLPTLILMNSWPRLHQEHSVTGFSHLYIQFPGGQRGAPCDTLGPPTSWLRSSKLLIAKASGDSQGHTKEVAEKKRLSGTPPAPHPSPPLPVIPP